MALLHVIQNLLDRPVLVLSSGCVLILALYIVYQRFFNPISRYPGPFLASLTDVWQYGPIVRYGPGKISITDEHAIATIYQKSSKSMPKSEFYDAFGGIHPNVFGTRDESHHAVRRRHMSHSFSMASIKEMEQYLDKNIEVLKEKVSRHAMTGKAFDLKKALHYYVVDVLFELAFSQSFGVQESEDDSQMPPVKAHTLLGSAMGAWPNMTGSLKQWLPKLPVQQIQSLFEGRKACVILASKSVQRRLLDLKSLENEDVSTEQQRKDILTSLILAKDPETGDRLTQVDLETEAFGFIIAGTHTTTATSALLFWHLLHNPRHMSDAVAEVDANLPPLTKGHSIYSMAEAEASLPFMRKCVRENFRVTPVFTMPLERCVTAPEGVSISGCHFPQGTILAVCNHAFHHNPDVWGEDHNVFDPNRWDRPEVAARAKVLMHFGLGGRQCIGKSMALTNIFKLLSTLLREFDFCLADDGERQKVKEGKFYGTLPPLISVGVSDLDEPLMVTARARVSK